MSDLERVRELREKEENESAKGSFARYWTCEKYLTRPEDCRTLAERRKAKADWRALHYAKLIEARAESDFSLEVSLNVWTLRRWCKWLEDAGIKPPNEGKWHPETVARLLARIDAIDVWWL